MRRPSLGYLGIPQGHGSMRGHRVMRRGQALGAAAEPKSKTDTLQTILTQATPVVRELMKGSATEDVETLRAQILNHEKIRDKTFEPLKTLYANKVVVLRSKLKAALKAQKDEAADRVSKTEWASLGKTGIVAAVAVGAAAVIALLAAAGYAHRSGRRVSSSETS